MRQLQFDGRIPSEHTPLEQQPAAAGGQQQQEQVAAEQQRQTTGQPQQHKQRHVNFTLPAGVKFVTVRWLSDSLAAANM
jgi:hypothetical protein